MITQNEVNDVLDNAIDNGGEDFVLGHSVEDIATDLEDSLGGDFKADDQSLHAMILVWQSKYKN